jgi:hypothetical protein
MNIKIRVFSLILIMTILISGGLGFMVGYSICWFKTYVLISPEIHSDMLLIESKEFVRKSDVNGLIDAIEKNGDFLASLINGFNVGVPNLYINDETKKKYSQSIEVWDEAKKKLEEIRTSYAIQSDLKH